MTEEALRMLWAVRLDGVRRLAEKASEFQECDQCRAISPKPLGLCPWCHGYRFKKSPARVRATLKVMAKSPWPVHAGVVPRIAFRSLPEPGKEGSAGGGGTDPTGGFKIRDNLK